jgi:outer membrane lipoprotein SlyB
MQPACRRHAHCKGSIEKDIAMDEDTRTPDDVRTPETPDNETHATTGGAALSGALVAGAIGLTGGPIAAAVGAVGGAIVGAAAERMMHSEDDHVSTMETTDVRVPNVDEHSQSTGTREE